jgi:DnaJ-class molecular chaperone
VDATVRLTIPPGTSSGTRLRLRGKGIKLPDGSRGDQIARIEITVPKLSEADRETIRLVEDLDRRTEGTAVRRF